MGVQRFSGPGRPLTSAEAETFLTEVLDELEENTEELAVARVEAARAEAFYRSQYARAQLTCGHKTEAARAAYALKVNEKLLEDRLVKAAEADGLAERCRTRRADIEALRTIIASARSAEHGRG